MYDYKILKYWGTFSNINSVVLSCIYENKKIIKPFYVNWNMDEDDRDWDKLFEQPYSIELSDVRDNYKEIPFHDTGYIVPINKDNTLLTPNKKQRKKVASIIEKYIRPSKQIKERIDQGLKMFENSYVIGVHIRGGGRIDDGTKTLRQKFELVHGIPLQEYCKYIDIAIKDNNNKENAKNDSKEIKIFLATDNEPTVSHMRSKYGDKLITYDSYRTPDYFGEEHHRRDNKSVSGQQLAEEVIIESYLLKNTNYFIHGNSNISNFVLCSNPEIEYRCIYD